eukprot:TRINITY_DN30067_c0_g2_i1.p1 TRINITY_DN30067_c0_g2~~TRINITY_DN30067_c0_g2_i1.p1  ORF type:complete len:1125 (+),score=366.54 TRINITY_DN30067_c0_g2_i1:36-3410(+)
MAAAREVWHCHAAVASFLKLEGGSLQRWQRPLLAIVVCVVSLWSLAQDDAGVRLLWAAGCWSALRLHDFHTQTSLCALTTLSLIAAGSSALWQAVVPEHHFGLAALCSSGLTLGLHLAHALPFAEAASELDSLALHPVGAFVQAAGCGGAGLQGIRSLRDSMVRFEGTDDDGTSISPLHMGSYQPDRLRPGACSSDLQALASPPCGHSSQLRAKLCHQRHVAELAAELAPEFASLTAERQLVQAAETRTRELQMQLAQLRGAATAETKTSMAKLTRLQQQLDAERQAHAEASQAQRAEAELNQRALEGQIFELRREVSHWQEEAEQLRCEKQSTTTEARHAANLATGLQARLSHQEQTASDVLASVKASFHRQAQDAARQFEERQLALEDELTASRQQSATLAERTRHAEDMLVEQKRVAQDTQRRLDEVTAVAQDLQVKLEVAARAVEQLEGSLEAAQSDSRQLKTLAVERLKALEIQRMSEKDELTRKCESLTVMVEEAVARADTMEANLKEQHSALEELKEAERSAKAAKEAAEGRAEKLEEALQEQRAAVHQAIAHVETREGAVRELQELLQAQREKAALEARRAAMRLGDLELQVAGHDEAVAAAVAKVSEDLEKRLDVALLEQKEAAEKERSAALQEQKDASEKDLSEAKQRGLEQGALLEQRSLELQAQLQTEQEGTTQLRSEVEHLQQRLSQMEKALEQSQVDEARLADLASRASEADATAARVAELEADVAVLLRNPARSTDVPDSPVRAASRQETEQRPVEGDDARSRSKTAPESPSVAGPADAPAAVAAAVAVEARLAELERKLASQEADTNEKTSKIEDLEKQLQGMRAAKQDPPRRQKAEAHDLREELVAQLASGRRLHSSSTGGLPSKTLEHNLGAYSDATTASSRGRPEDRGAAGSRHVQAARPQCGGSLEPEGFRSAAVRIGGGYHVLRTSRRGEQTAEAASSGEEGEEAEGEEAFEEEVLTARMHGRHSAAARHRIALAQASPGRYRPAEIELTEEQLRRLLTPASLKAAALQQGVPSIGKVAAQSGGHYQRSQSHGSLGSSRQAGRPLRRPPKTQLDAAELLHHGKQRELREVGSPTSAKAPRDAALLEKYHAAELLQEYRNYLAQ